MASSIPYHEEELRKALETLINFSAYTEKAKMDPEKYSNLEQSMQTDISIITEIMHKAKDCHINCREYLLNCQSSLLRPTPGRDMKELNSNPIDSGINSGIIAEETGDAEESEQLTLAVYTKESNA